MLNAIVPILSKGAPSAISLDYLVIAGGGGGGYDRGAGGGAGGLRSTVTATGGGGRLETALSFTSQDVARFNPGVNADPINGQLPAGDVGMDQIMGLMGGR